MNSMHWQKWISGALAGVLCAAALAAAQERYEDTQAIVQFQRAADSYALTHRQVERKLSAADQMPAALRAARSGSHQNVFFTPAVQVAFRNRITHALRSPECVAELANQASQEGRVACVTKVLPHLPDELEYIVFGRTLLLVDRHVHIVVDVFLDAFNPPETR